LPENLGRAGLKGKVWQGALERENPGQKKCLKEGIKKAAKKGLKKGRKSRQGDCPGLFDRALPENPGREGQNKADRLPTSF
jgi:hypothetical protein